jgi:hypothetical protein
MRFPILIKRSKVFVWYRGHWINISLEAQAHGDGFKGYCRFFWHWARCVVGIHRKGHFAGFVHDENDKRIVGFESYTACMYCHEHKEVKHE